MRMTMFLVSQVWPSFLISVAEVRCMDESDRCLWWFLRPCLGGRFHLGCIP
jgi:hypothetical protein